MVLLTFYIYIQERELGFYKLRREIRLAMAHIEKEFPFSEDEIKTIKELCETLQPVEVVVKYICKVSLIL